MSALVVGLDLSLSSSGVTVIPTDWGGDTRKVYWHECRLKPRKIVTDEDRARRIESMLCQVMDFVLDFDRSIEAVAIESLPTKARSLVVLAELHGVIRLELLDRHLYTLTAPEAAARKLLLGALPRSDRKTITLETVRSLPGLAEIGPDAADAFVAANWALAEQGHGFVAVQGAA